MMNSNSTLRTKDYVKTNFQANKNNNKILMQMEENVSFNISTYT